MSSPNLPGSSANRALMGFGVLGGVIFGDGLAQGRSIEQIVGGAMAVIATLISVVTAIIERRTPPPR